ncbi:NUDIX hydrolase [Treponema sp.]|uniref:NUDIX hydrolase n=2 Tax=Treponema sp. TaxID=166 RepID=UPI002A800C60|nr:NUDIX hydrolase [Treponema sp.]MCI6441369.1 NUDIX hydrolase [Spirochaetia bacterium]MDY4131701.1 NUDIX hydrolase [Treponema sp.]
MKSDEELTWTTESKKELFKTPVFTVTSRHNKSVSGIVGDYIVNECPDWVIVIAEKDDNFLMVKQYRHGEEKLSIEFPGGVIDAGENPEQAAARELLEETGATASSLVHLGSMNPNPALFANHFHVYLATGLTFSGKQELDNDELLDYLELPKKEVLKKMGSAEYPHALMCSAAALYMARNL